MNQIKYNDPRSEIKKFVSENLKSKKGEFVNIPDSSLPYALMQRVGAQKLWNSNILHKLLFNRFPNFFTYQKVVNTEAKILTNCKKSINNEIFFEFNFLIPYLPKRVNSVLDIGCGVAIFDVLLYKYYGDQINIYLLDKSQVDDKKHPGYRSDDRFYSSMSEAVKLLTSNGVSPDNIKTQEVNKKYSIDFNAKIDLIISMASWGFHYPIETYLDKVYQMLNNDGTLIIDVRKGTNALDEVSKSFKDVKIITEWKKGYKIVANK